MTEKKPHLVELKDSQLAFLDGIVAEHNLADRSKAVRILIEFAIAEPAERERIFGEVRCRDC